MTLIVEQRQFTYSKDTGSLLKLGHTPKEALEFFKSLTEGKEGWIETSYGYSPHIRGHKDGKGECISDDCLCKGHNVPLDKDVKYYTQNGDILLNSELSFIQLSYGEWSSSMPKAYINIESLDEIPCNIGDIIFIAEEGTYTEHKIVSKPYKDGWNLAAKYNIDSHTNLDKYLENIPETFKELFKAGWNDYFIHIT